MALDDATSIEFDTDNMWDKIDCRKYAGYEVKLSNGLEVELDNAGRIREIDD